LISNFESGRQYGFSQGRLTVPPKGQLQWFPQEAWRTEFLNAGKIGCSFIELLIERERNPFNPIWTVSGRREIIDLCVTNGLVPYSICFDYIIDNSLLDDPDKSNRLSISECLLVASELGCQVVVLPLLEESSFNTDDLVLMANIVAEVGQLAAKYNILLCVETLLPADELNRFIDMINLNNVKAVFDTGNRVLETPDLRAEITKLGGNIGHVHIKDKDRSGNNVELGSGLVDFCGVFSALDKINYQGPLNFETNRGSVPLDTAKFNIILCEFFSRNYRNYMGDN
jgi:sugar phosphate isomerase/epimerase